GTKAQLVKSTVAELENRFPAMRDYSVAQREHTTEDIAHIIDFLATALYVDDDDLFTTFIVWTAEVLEARGVPATSLIPALDLLSDQLQDFPRTQRL
ncbi:cobalamin-binding protein, partial [Mycolicibacterium elephantis]